MYHRLRSLAVCTCFAAFGASAQAATVGYVAMDHTGSDAFNAAAVTLTADTFRGDKIMDWSASLKAIGSINTFGLSVLDDLGSNRLQSATQDGQTVIAGLNIFATTLWSSDDN